MSLTAFGQVSSSISGVVHDPNGEVISGATVIVQDNFNKAADGFYSRVDARLDAIEEVTISTATPGAESSAQGAIQIKYVTRQGSNQFHGSVYEYHRNPSLNANYWFNNRDQAPVHKETGLICGTPQQFTRFDLSAVKRIKIKEGVNFELRGEFLNAFNNVNFFNPSGNAFTSPTSQTLHAGDGSLSGLVQHQRSGRPAGADSRPDQLLTSTFNVLGEALFGTALPQFLISVQT